MEPVVNELPNDDLHLYFTEVKDCHPEHEIEEEHTVLDEVEQARDFLLKAGLSDLSIIYQEGNEISDSIVNDSVRDKYLTEKQAQTVRSRVRTLNKTLANRKPRRKQRQDVRDVAWKIETSSTGSRSRSATPDSLLNEELTSDEDQQLPNLASEAGRDDPNRRKLKLTTVEPHQNSKVFQRQCRDNIAHLDSNNVVLKGYYPLEENRIAKPRRERSGSDPSPDILTKQQNDSEGYLSSSPNFISSHCPISLAAEAVPLSFEEIIRSKKDDYYSDWVSETRSEVICIDDIKDCEYQHLKPLLWVEVTSIFDQYKIFTLKRKQNKSKRGNVFNVNLSTLVMRDMPNPLENTMVPQIYQTIVSQLTNRCLREEGIMRIGGQKQKLEILCKDIEEHFYSNRQIIEQALAEASVHALTGVLKKLLRELPDTIFTMELFDMFYKTSFVPVLEDKIRALNLLVLLLPIEHRNTFRYLTDFFLKIIANEQYNRMNLHNVATIIAPSFFVPRILTPGYSRTPEKLTKEQMIQQISTAATCCSIMELVLKTGEKLWMIPKELVVQAKEAQKKVLDRRGFGIKDRKTHTGKKKLQRSNTQYEPGAILSPKITRDYIL